MLSFSFSRWLKSVLRSRRQTIRNKLRYRLSLEHLEDRLAPATFIWTGAGGNPNWSTGANWFGGIAPSGSAATLDDLVFPAGPNVKITRNDLSAPTFNSISISGTGYTLDSIPGRNQITLGDPLVSGSGTVFVNSGATNELMMLDLQLAGPSGTRQFFTVNANADLTLAGQLSGTNGSELAKE